MRPLLLAVSLLLASLPAQKPAPVVEAEKMYQRGEIPAAIEYLREQIRSPAFATLSALERAAFYGSLGTLAHEQGDYRQAEQAYRQGTRVCGGGEFGELCAVAMSNNLATVFLEAADLARAEAEIERNAKRNLEKFGTTSAEVLRWWGNRGSLAYARSRAKEAVEWYRRALEGWERRGEANTLDGIIVRSNIGLALLEDERYAEAIPYLEEALRGVEAQPPHIQSRLPIALMNLGVAQAMAGRTAAAGSLLRRSTEEAVRRLGPAHVVTGIVTLRHGEFLMKWGDKGEGKRRRREAMEILQSFRREQGFEQRVDVAAFAFRRK